MKLSTPAAILIGSAMIAAGVYFGLAARPPAPPPPAPTPAPERSAPPAQADLAAVRAQAARALEAQRPALARACAAELKGPLTWTFNLSFGPDGRQVTRGVTAPREAPPELTNCLQRTLEPLAVTPPGAGAFVEVPLTLP